MSVLIWWTALVAGIVGATWLVLGLIGGGWLYMALGSLNLLLAVVEARFGVARLLHSMAEATSELVEVES